jgi:hypothetical protein
MKERSKKGPIRTDPELWEACKKEAIERLGKFSARAMQHAVLLYKQRGGGYIGAKDPESAIARWQREEGKRFDEK